MDRHDEPSNSINIIWLTELGSRKQPGAYKVTCGPFCGQYLPRFVYPLLLPIIAIPLNILK